MAGCVTDDVELSASKLSDEVCKICVICLSSFYICPAKDDGSISQVP